MIASMDSYEPFIFQFPPTKGFLSRTDMFAGPTNYPQVALECVRTKTVESAKVSIVI